MVFGCLTRGGIKCLFIYKPNCTYKNQEDNIRLGKIVVDVSVT